jgi:hypothetical protein
MQSLQTTVENSKKLEECTPQELNPENVLEAKTAQALETTPKPEPTQEIRLVDIPINSENIALNVMVGFLNVAHKRGSFTIDETAKIWECISKFQKV